jgi:type I site-specific restriction endonuclease
VEGVRKVLTAIQHGSQKRFLHYYAPRTGKTFVQASLAYWLMKLSSLDLHKTCHFL